MTGAAAIFSLALLLAACGGDGSSNPAPSSSLSGTVQGGLSPLSDATVTLYQAGAQGYGSGAKSLGHATTDSSGNFTVRYSRPATFALLYLAAVGGNAGSGGNAAIGLIGIAGMSNALPATVALNELTTVAAEWALAQFTDASGRNIGTTSTNTIGFQNAAKLAQTNLVDIAAGAPAGFWPDAASCGGGSAPLNCEGLERLNSLANLLAACVDSAGPTSAACKALSDNTAGISDTLAAAHAIASNPGRNADALFLLSQGSDAYAPVLSQSPGAWTIALLYVGNGAEFDGPGNLAIDANGNVWASNNYVFNSDPTVPTCGGKELIELTPTGVDAPGAPFTGGGVDGAGFGIVIDATANVWVGNFGFEGTGCTNPSPGNSVSLFKADGTPLSPGTGFTQGSVDGPQGIALDQMGDLWIANYHGNTITEYPAGDPANALNFAGLGFDRPFDVAIDAVGHAWITSSGNDRLFGLNADGSQVAGSPFTGNGLSMPLGVVVDTLGNVWVANSLGDSVSMFDSSGAPNPKSPFKGGGVELPWGIAVDGNDNIWVANFTGNDERLSELCGARTANCPAGLKTGDPITPGAGYASSLLTRLTGVEIDASGNVWVPDNWESVPLQTNPGGHGLVEFVGLAAPVKTPTLGPPQKP
ncbi:MAG: NHL repeat-containing protein [Candidatus Binatus sp.]|uniref:NHL repeat-containing protein n=1 Tax=Candidatus Binatus sp. TaxID=2811406 RepID=UPI00272250A5|nr:NHL repeat-containing protein [Candidatus Binatus sp.]MDO8434577.1 NHL repeat-containing protein [Candidatus Binatus sp.]